MGLARPSICPEVLTGKLIPAIPVTWSKGKHLKDLLDALDHPIVFVFALMLALAGMSSIFIYATKSVGLFGAAKAVQQ
jgi:hypothetical protein